MFAGGCFGLWVWFVCAAGLLVLMPGFWFNSVDYVYFFVLYCFAGC